MDWLVNIFKYVLQFFFNLTHNYGWAIILLTLTIKVILFPSSIKQFRSMDKMKRVQPKLKEIQDKYKDKPDEVQKRMMDLYKKEGVNPFGSCLPMIIQLLLLYPIFFLLSDVKFGIITAEAFKNTHFLWFNLTDKGIPLINGSLAVISALTTFLQTKLTTPATGAGEQGGQQQIFLYIMPVVFGFVTYSVNAGMALYWITSNLIGIIQQYVINEYFIVKEHIQKEDQDDKEPTNIKEFKDAKNKKEVKEINEEEVEAIEESPKNIREHKIEDLKGKKSSSGPKEIKREKEFLDGKELKIEDLRGKRSSTSSNDAKSSKEKKNK